MCAGRMAAAALQLSILQRMAHMCAYKIFLSLLASICMLLLLLLTVRLLQPARPPSVQQLQHVHAHPPPGQTAALHAPAASGAPRLAVPAQLRPCQSCQPAPQPAGRAPPQVVSALIMPPLLRQLVQPINNTTLDNSCASQQNTDINSVSMQRHAAVLYMFASMLPASQLAHLGSLCSQL